MNPPKGEEAIFDEALRLPPQERAGYVAQATSGGRLAKPETLYPAFVMKFSKTGENRVRLAANS
jgi:hypothetical protein